MQALVEPKREPDAVREPNGEPVTPPNADKQKECLAALGPCRPACRARFDKDAEPSADPDSDPLFVCETSCSTQYKACLSGKVSTVSIDQALSAGVSAAKNKTK